MYIKTYLCCTLGEVTAGVSCLSVDPFNWAPGQGAPVVFGLVFVWNSDFLLFAGPHICFIASPAKRASPQLNGPIYSTLLTHVSDILTDRAILAERQSQEKNLFLCLRAAFTNVLRPSTQMKFFEALFLKFLRICSLL